MGKWNLVSRRPQNWSSKQIHRELVEGDHDIYMYLCVCVWKYINIYTLHIYSIYTEHIYAYTVYMLIMKVGINVILSRGHSETHIHSRRSLLCLVIFGTFLWEKVEDRPFRSVLHLQQLSSVMKVCWLGIIFHFYIIWIVLVRWILFFSFVVFKKLEN